MQRIAIYGVSALALAAAVWLVLPAREAQQTQAAQPGVAARPDHPSAGSSGSASRLGASGGNAGSAADDTVPATSSDTSPRRIALPAADAESLAAGAESGSSSSPSSSGASNDSTSGTTATGADPNAPAPLPVVVGSAPAPAPILPGSAGPGVDPSELVSDPTPIEPGTNEPPGEDLPRLTPNQIWQRVQEECVDCTHAEQEAMYLDIDRKSGIAAGLAR